MHGPNYAKLLQFACTPATPSLDIVSDGEEWRPYARPNQERAVVCELRQLAGEISLGTVGQQLLKTRVAEIAASVERAQRACARFSSEQAAAYGACLEPLAELDHCLSAGHLASLTEHVETFAACVHHVDSLLAA